MMSFHFFNLLCCIIGILIILESNIYRINTLRLSKKGLYAPKDLYHLNEFQMLRLPK